MRVFVYHTVKCFMDTEGVSELYEIRPALWFVRHRLYMLLGQELTEILSKNKVS